MALFIVIAIIGVILAAGAYLMFHGDGFIADDEMSERLSEADREQRIREGKLE